jgi:hypothetical protein
VVAFPPGPRAAMRYALFCALLPCEALAHPNGMFGYSGQSGSICNSCHGALSLRRRRPC